MSLDLFDKRKYLVDGFSKKEFSKTLLLPVVILKLIMWYLESIYQWKLKISNVPHIECFMDICLYHQDRCKWSKTFIFQKKPNCMFGEQSKFRIGVKKGVVISSPTQEKQIWWNFDSFNVGFKQPSKQFIIEMFCKENQLHGTASFSLSTPSDLIHFSSIGKISGFQTITDFTEINLQFKIYTRTENQ